MEEKKEKKKRKEDLFHIRNTILDILNPRIKVIRTIAPLWLPWWVSPTHKMEKKKRKEVGLCAHLLPQSPVCPSGGGQG